MSHDLFISYSRRDDRRHHVKALKTQIEAAFRAFAGRELRVFFDVGDIHGMDDWRMKIQQSLRESQLFLAVLSPNYLASPYCRWEWEDYVRYEAIRQCLGEGIAPVFFVTLPDIADVKTEHAIARWIDEIQRRQTFDLRVWHDAGETSLQHPHVKRAFGQLLTSVRQRLDRLELARRSPDNLLKHNPAFVGRVRELAELRSALAKNKLGVVGPREGQAPGRATVQGLGGMGKTELALAYAHSFAWDYPGGRWQIGCEHIGDLRVALLQLAGPMKFEFTDEENRGVALAFERVLRELNHRERCLLLLDNVSDPRILEPAHVDRLPHDGRVDLVATTRLAPRNIPGSMQAHAFIAVDELPEEDALALLRSHQPHGRFPNQEEDDDARQIVRLLEGFTLAVETAAIYLGRHAGEITCAQFLNDLRARLLEHSEETAGDSTVAVRHRERLLEKTLAFTLDILPLEALHLLYLAALLPADAIALPWLQAVGAEQFAALNKKPEAPNSTFRTMSELLLGLRLLQTTGLNDADGHLLLARMHRLVQEILARRAAFRQVPLTQTLVARSRRVGQKVSGRRRAIPQAALFDRLVRHAKERANSLAEHWLDWARRWEISPLRAFSEVLLTNAHRESPELANLTGSCLHRLARYAEAEPLYRRALAIDEERYGPDHLEIARDLNNLAELLKATDRIAEAEPLLRRALAISERGHGPNHPVVALYLNNLAQVLKTRDRVAEAETLLRRALAISEQNYGHHPLGVAALTNLGLLMQDMNRLADAEPLFRRAVSINEQNYGPNHPDVAKALNNLALLLQATNRFAAAEPLMRRALAMDEQGYGPDHPDVARDLNNLARLLQETNRMADAEPLIRRALAINEQNYGPDHTSVARSLRNLAGLLQTTNRSAEAEPLIRRALAIHERSYGPNHPLIATALNNLGLLLQASGRPAEAEPLLRRGLVIYEQSHGPDHPHVAANLNNLALVLFDTDQLADAVLLMRRVVSIEEKCSGEDHPNLAIALNNLARMLQACNQLTEAETLSRRAVEILFKFTCNTGHAHSYLQTAIDNYAELLSLMGRSRKHALRQINALAAPYGIRASD